ncbi:MAG: PRC-barrel domain-containing protein [Firmicutes bacterium]|nr:PRC-barrel domain-containing protein [Bacillota bacterium]
MRRRTDTVDLPVVAEDSGRTVGKVKDLVFDLGCGRLEGLRVAVGADEVFLPFDTVRLDLTRVTVRREAEIGRARVRSRRGGGTTGGREAHEPPLGRPVVTRAGRLIGLVDDIVFDPESGTVWGYELSTGFITDFVEGKKAVPLTDELVVGPAGVVVVDPDELRPAGESDAGEGSAP